jgi:uncharacterized protein (UPF0261 family)
MAAGKPLAAESSRWSKPLLAATMFGVTTPCVTEARKVLEAAGYEVLVFHATGTGGRAMEGLIEDGYIAGVLDVTTTELADELVGGILSAGPRRLTVAGAAGVPQVVSLGALDMVNFGPRPTVPAKFADRKFYQHNAAVTLMRTTGGGERRAGRPDRTPVERRRAGRFECSSHSEASRSTRKQAALSTTQRPTPVHRTAQKGAAARDRGARARHGHQRP